MLSFTHLGVYSVAVTLSEVQLLISNSTSSLLLQRSATRRYEFGEKAVTTARLNIWLSLAIGAVLAPAGGVIIAFVYGAPFSDAWLPLVILLPGTALLSVWQTLLADLLPRGKSHYKFYSAALGLVISFSLMVILLPSLELKGAAIATAAGYVGSSSLVIWLYVRSSPVRVSDILVPKIGDVSMVWQAGSAFIKRVR